METTASAIALLPNKGDTAWLMVATAFVTVSYTHLTLPTSDLV